MFSWPAVSDTDVSDIILTMAKEIVKKNESPLLLTGQIRHRQGVSKNRRNTSLTRGVSSARHRQGVSATRGCQGKWCQRQGGKHIICN